MLDAYRMRRGLRALGWAGITLSLLLLSLLATWYAWAAVDFAYPFWYQTLSIDAHIERYGPQNHIRPGFQNTTDAERMRLFGEIVDAIQHQPQDLATLKYHRPDGSVIGRLLRPAEIQHLRDVAALIRGLERFAWLGVTLGCLLAAVAALRRWPLPPLRHFVIGALLPALCLGACVALIGPVEVFDALHRWTFPPDHQWFFYYEQSLMTILMKAPDLFAGIAGQWAASAALVFAGLIVVQRRLHARLRRRRA